jgi:hypothetical protein
VPSPGLIIDKLKKAVPEMLKNRVLELREWLNKQMA